jgi:hypothetical protein
MKQFLALLTSLLLACGLAGANESNATAGALHSISEWVQTQRILSEETTRWQQERAFLNQTIHLLAEEAQLLEARIGELAVAGERSARDRQALVGENDQFRGALAEAGDLLALLQAGLDELRPILPGPLQARIEPLFARFGAAGGIPDDLGPRLLAVVGILGEVNRFQGNVTLAREAMEMDDGIRREVRTVYLGLGQAFFVDDRERVAGVGRPGRNGWDWTRHDDIASAVGRTVAVIEGRRAAEFIQLPVGVAP